MATESLHLRRSGAGPPPLSLAQSGDTVFFLDEQLYDLVQNKNVVLFLLNKSSALPQCQNTFLVLSLALTKVHVTQSVSQTV